MRKDVNKDLIQHFLEKLEEYGLEIGSKLDELEKEKSNYVFFARIKKLIEDNTINFCSSYIATSEEGKKEFHAKLLELFKDQEIVDNIIQEIINMYYLHDAGLLDLDETLPQKEIAEENIRTLVLKIDKYLEETNIDQLKQDDERLSSKLDKVVLLGTTIESNEPNAVDDIDFLEEIIELLDLSDEEKKQLLMEIAFHNISVYKQNIELKKAKKEIDNREIGELDDSLTITPECREEIEFLLANKEIVQRIVDVINDDFTTVIDIRSGDFEVQSEINESVQMAREEIERRIKEDRITPREALNNFFQEFDETEKKKREYLKKLLEGTKETVLSRREQEELLDLANTFLEERKALISEMSSSEKEKVRTYMISVYRDKDDRNILYQSDLYKNNNSLDGEAAYEIAIYLELLESVPEEDHETISKVCKKIEEILAAVDLVRANEQAPKEVEEGNLFFIMKDDNTSTLEEDIGIASKRKGLNSVYYNEIKNQLTAIEDRSNRRIFVSQPVNPGFKAIKREGVKYTTGTRTKVFFIPVGKKDSIIVGVSFITGKDNTKDQDNRVKRYLEQIEELRDRLLDPDTYIDEKIKATKERNKIMSILSTSKELDAMLEEEEPKEERKQK